MEYTFSWQITDKFEGRVRASSEAEAWALAQKGVIYGEKVEIGKPSHIQLTGAVSR